MNALMSLLEFHNYQLSIINYQLSTPSLIEVPMMGDNSNGSSNDNGDVDDDDSSNGSSNDLMFPLYHLINIIEINPDTGSSSSSSSRK